jgi:hypothetical protein
MFSSVATRPAIASCPGVGRVNVHRVNACSPRSSVTRARTSAVSSTRSPVRSNVPAGMCAQTRTRPWRASTAGMRGPVLASGTLFTPPRVVPDSIALRCAGFAFRRRTRPQGVRRVRSAASSVPDRPFSRRKPGIVRAAIMVVPRLPSNSRTAVSWSRAPISSYRCFIRS